MELTTEMAYYSMAIVPDSGGWTWASERTWASWWWKDFNDLCSWKGFNDLCSWKIVRVLSCYFWVHISKSNKIKIKLQVSSITTNTQFHTVGLAFQRILQDKKKYLPFHVKQRNFLFQMFYNQCNEFEDVKNSLQLARNLQSGKHVDQKTQRAYKWIKYPTLKSSFLTVSNWWS